jgi:branched-chain amino acid transport system substrate-binding protein
MAGFALAACGSDDDDDTPTEAAAPATEAATTETPASEPAASETATGEPAGSEAATGEAATSAGATSEAATSEPAAPSGDPVVVGVSISLSGEFSDQGEVVQRGYELWAKHANENGGLLGRPVELKVLSDGSSPEQVVTNYEQLITREKVDVLLGPFSTGLSKPASVVAHRHGYAFFSGLAGGPEIVEQGFPEVLNVALDGSTLMNAFAEWSMQQPEPPKTVAYLVLDNDFTIPIAENAKKAFEAGGVETVVDERYPPDLKDFAALARKVSSAEADVVVLGSAFEETVAFIQAFAQQRYNPKAVITVQGPDFGSAFGEALGEGNAAGVMAPATWNVELATPGNQEFVDAYVAEYGGAPADIVDFAAMAYSTGEVISQVVAAAGSLEQQALIDSAHAGPYETITGPVQLDERGLNTAATGITLQWQDGKPVIVLPEDVGAAPLQYPKPEWGG